MPKPEIGVLLIALDAGDSRLIKHWAAAGELPTLRRMLDDGFVADLDDLPALWSSSVWPTLITGLSPARHGEWLYQRYDPATYASTLNREGGPREPPFWTRLVSAGLRVALLEVPQAALEDDLGDGLQLCDWAPHEPEGSPRSNPARFAGEIAARFGPDPVGQCDYLGRGPADFEVFRDRLVRRVRTRRDLTAHVLELGPWDLVVSTFNETHCAGHQTWHLHDPAHPRHDAVLAGRIGDPLLAVYREVDRAIGDLLEAAGPRTRCLVLATHGIGPSFAAHFSLQRVLERIESARATGAHALSGMQRIWRRLPYGLRGVLRPAGRGIRRRLTRTGRRHRRAFEIGTHCAYAGLRVNLEGREVAGRVAASELAATLASLRGTLEGLIDPASRRPVVRRVWDLSEVYPRSPDDRLPDLVVEWETDLPAGGVVAPGLGSVPALGTPVFPNRTGNHRPHGGLLLACGGGIPGGRLDRRARPEDLAPTVLAALGVDSAGLDGSAIQEVARRG